MEIFTHSLPLWVSILFIVCIVIPVFMIRRVVRQGAISAGIDMNKVEKISIGVMLFYSVFYFYVTLMSFTTIFKENSLPPKILLYTAVPLLLFYFVYVFRTKMYWQILENIQLSSLVQIHTFRFVGIFFLIGWYYGVLPKEFAFIAGLGDIFVAITAIVVAYLAHKKTDNYKTITLVWNIVGFWDIVSVIISAVYVTKQAIESGSEGILAMSSFPFCLIPAFAPATIIFLHISIFKKLKMEK